MRKKSELYEKEQSELVDKIIDILQLDNDNTITLYQLDHDEDKKKKIHDIIPILRKYFSYDAIEGLMNPDKMKRPYLSIIRQITKLKYKMISRDARIKVNGDVIRTKRYTFVLK